ncbi:MAG TPA: dTMP kinase [Allosphingosinicella sp.]|nr:dTMP kinase [Allosphingosinicella sp.]
MTSGRFITLEGGEGVGKSTQLKALAEALRARGLDIVTTREPGGSPGAEAIRALLLDGADEGWGPEAEALLFAAARTDHLDKVIRPALEAGRWVLSDRFVDSSLAYQGVAGELGLDAVRRINAFGIGDRFPDRTLVLVSAEGAARARARDTDGGDRIGRRSAAYHDAVERGFRTVADQEPERVRLIDASGTPDEVTARLLAALADLLP